MSSFRKLVGLLALTVALLVAACGAQSSPAGTHPFTVGLTYIPNIQFAPFYVAKSLGYYRDAGLDVTLHHHAFGDDEFGALVTGQETAIIAGGDEILQARDKGIKVTYLAPIYTRYPVTLIVPASSNIQSAADLRGHSIGIPGPYGASYIALLAMLQGAGLKTSDVTIQNINYNQISALLGGKVDAVIGYLNNEPIAFQKHNFAVRTIPVFQPNAPAFLSNGLAAMQSEITAHPDDVKKFIAATLRGVQYVNDHPADALRLSQQFVPTLQDPAQRADALAVLQASIPLWQNTGQPMDATAWQAMATFMQANGLLKTTVNVADCFSNSYLPSH